MSVQSSGQDPQLAVLPQDTTTLTVTDNPTRPLDITDALAYLKLVKGRFRERPEVYDQFLDVMKGFKGKT